MNYRLSDFYEEFTQAFCILEKGKILKRHLGKLDILSYSLFNKNTLQYPELNHISLSNYPSLWLEEYKKNEFYKEDDALLKTLSGSDLTLWNTSNKSNKVYNAAADFGIRHGVSVPIGCGDTSKTVLTVTQNSKKELKTFIESPEFKWAELCATFFHASVNYSLEKSSLYSLTSKEKEILYWVALGKNDQDIADIEGISIFTVKQHVKCLLNKLNAENRTSAASIARQLEIL